MDGLIISNGYEVVDSLVAEVEGLAEARIQGQQDALDAVRMRVLDDGGSSFYEFLIDSGFFDSREEFMPNDVENFIEGLISVTLSFVGDYSHE